MPGLVNNFEEQELIKDYENTFLSFSRPIVVWKQPVETQLITAPTNPGLFGMGDGQVASQITYIPVSGIFQAIVRYVNTKRNIGYAGVIDGTNTIAAEGEVTIKVQPDCWAFIENSGQTDKINFDSRDFYFSSKYKAMPFLGALYYQYQLKPKS